MSATAAIARKRSSSVDLLSVPKSDANRPKSIACDPSQSRPLSDTADYSSSLGDGVNLLSYRRINTLRSLTSNERWHSDTNIALDPSQEGSRISVNKSEIDINDDLALTLHWDIKENVSAKDWIGLYKAGKLSSYERELVLVVYLYYLWVTTIIHMYI